MKAKMDQFWKGREEAKKFLNGIKGLDKETQKKEVKTVLQAIEMRIKEKQEAKNANGVLHLLGMQAHLFSFLLMSYFKYERGFAPYPRYISPRRKFIMKINDLSWPEFAAFVRFAGYLPTFHLEGAGDGSVEACWW